MGAHEKLVRRSLAGVGRQHAGGSSAFAGTRICSSSFAHDPAAYTNDHLTDSWQAAIRRHNKLGKKLNLFYGAEAYRDTIDSNNYSSRAKRLRSAITRAIGAASTPHLDWRPVSGFRSRWEGAKNTTATGTASLPQPSAAGIDFPSA